jgi:error-prone DNA polymerase
LKVKPIDVMKSDWLCTLEQGPPSSSQLADTGRKPANSVRLGMRYAKGLREDAAGAIVRERDKQAFSSLEDLARRVPQLRKNELVTLAAIGALNSVSVSQPATHRRDALWQVERAARRVGPLLETAVEPESASPLARMSAEERLVADFRGTGLTVGPHAMAQRRAELQARGVRTAADLQQCPDGEWVRIAGSVIARQRPGTARGFVFLSMEDETGIANAIITPDLFEQNRLLLIREQFLMVEGRLQNLDNVRSVKAARVLPLSVTAAPMSSHDFH